MAVTHDMIELAASPTIITLDTGNVAAPALSTSIQNVSTTARVFFGSNNVSTSYYGLVIEPGEMVTFNPLTWRNEIYAVTDEPGSVIAILRIDR